MNLDYEAIEHLKLALSRLSKAKRLLQNELMKVESCNNNRLSRSVIEESYVAAIDTFLPAQSQDVYISVGRGYCFRPRH